MLEIAHSVFFNRNKSYTAYFVTLISDFGDIKEFYRHDNGIMAVFSKEAFGFLGFF